MNKETAQAMLVLFQQGSDGIHRTTGQHWLLQAPITTIGRWDDNDIVIADRWISRHHAQVRREGTRYTLYDLDSKNGLFLNGQRLPVKTGLIVGSGLFRHSNPG